MGHWISYWYSGEPQYTPQEVLEMWDRCNSVGVLRTYYCYSPEDCAGCGFIDENIEINCRGKAKKEMLLNFLVFIGVEI